MSSWQSCWNGVGGGDVCQGLESLGHSHLPTRSTYLAWSCSAAFFFATLHPGFQYLSSVFITMRVKLSPTPLVPFHSWPWFTLASTDLESDFRNGVMLGTFLKMISSCISFCVTFFGFCVYGADDVKLMFRGVLKHSYSQS